MLALFAANGPRARCALSPGRPVPPRAALPAPPGRRQRPVTGLPRSGTPTAEAAPARWPPLSGFGAPIASPRLPAAAGFLDLCPAGRCPSAPRPAVPMRDAFPNDHKSSGRTTSWRLHFAPSPFLNCLRANPRRASTHSRRPDLSPSLPCPGEHKSASRILQSSHQICFPPPPQWATLYLCDDPACSQAPHLKASELATRIHFRFLHYSPVSATVTTLTSNNGRVFRGRGGAG